MGSLSYPTESPERLMSTQVHLLNQLIVVLEYCRCSRVSWWVLSRYHNIRWCRGKDFSKILGSGAKDTPQNLYNDERGFFFSPECRQVPQVPPSQRCLYTFAALSYTTIPCPVWGVTNPPCQFLSVHWKLFLFELTLGTHGAWHWDYTRGSIGIPA